MGPDPGFLRRLYAETALLLLQEPERGLATAPLLQRLLALLVQPEEQITSAVGALSQATPPAMLA